MGWLRRSRDVRVPCGWVWSASRALVSTPALINEAANFAPFPRSLHELATCPVESGGGRCAQNSDMQSSRERSAEAPSSAARLRARSGRPRSISASAIATAGIAAHAVEKNGPRARRSPGAASSPARRAARSGRGGTARCVRARRRSVARGSGTRASCAATAMLGRDAPRRRTRAGSRSSSSVPGAPRSAS